MEVLHRRCAGLDVHKATVLAAVRVHEGQAVERQCRSLGTTTRQLLELVEWLASMGVTHVAMEATGVYWKPVWQVLEGHFTLILANAREVRNVPGRKSDVNDATWLADLLAHGLVRSSLVPPRPIQQLRELTRTRKQMVRQIGQQTLRIQKTLESANLKLSDAISDVVGVSGRAILRGIIAGVTDPAELLSRTTGRLKAPKQQLLDCLSGAITDHHRFLLRLHLEQIETLERHLQELESEIDRRLQPFRSRLDDLETIPGVRRVAASVLFAETGGDMSAFPSADHLVSWAGLCPRLDESAGKQRSTKVRKSGRWLKTTMIQCAWAAVKKRDTYLAAKFARLRVRCGANKAIVAIAADQVRAAYVILQRAVPYRDLGPERIEKNRRRTAHNLAKRLRQLGYNVQLPPAA